MDKDELTVLFKRTFKSGPMRRIPKKPVDATAMLALSVAQLDASAFYDEGEIDTHLRAWLSGIALEDSDADHVTWRRALVDHGLLRRATDGVIYRLQEARIAEVITREARRVNPKEIFAEVEVARIERNAQYGPRG